MASQTHGRIVLILGGTGFIGREIGGLFYSRGYAVRIASRNPDAYQHKMPFPCEFVAWDGQTINAAAVDGVYAVVNLVGAPIVDHRWSDSYKSKLRLSRLQACQALSKAVAVAAHPPQVIVQASAVGYYQGNGESINPESAKPGSGFIGQLCADWEKASQTMADHARLVTLRIGVVLGWSGGALPKLWDLYSVGLGSALGSGLQWMNWIHLDDLKAIFLLALENEACNGVYNAVAPKNATNKDLHLAFCERTASLGFAKAPGFALKAVMGERAAILLESFHVVPERLIQAGFEFKAPDLKRAMGLLLAERGKPSLLFLGKKQWLPFPLQEVWEFSSKAQNLERITPEFLNFKIKKSSTPQIQKGTEFEYGISLHGIPMSWRSLISTWNPPHSFTDIQLKGPYKTWHHWHGFKELAGGTLLEDRIDFELPFFPFSGLALPFVRKDLERIFDFRQKAYALHLKSSQS